MKGTGAPSEGSNSDARLLPRRDRACGSQTTQEADLKPRSNQIAEARESREGTVYSGTRGALVDLEHDHVVR